jgi:hypothetical protein
MKEEELRELGIRNTELLKGAIREGNREKIDKLIKKIPREFLGLHSTYISIITNMLGFEKKLFEESQNALTEGIEKCLKNQEKEKALALLEEKERQHTMSYNTYLDFILKVSSHIIENYGEDALYQTFRYSASQQKYDMGKVREAPVEANVKAAAAMFKALMGKMSIKEDEKKFTFIQDPCGSGGRLLRERAYALPRGFLKIKNAHAMTLQRSNFPSWCAHCMVWNGIMMIEWLGFPQWVFEPPKDADDPCVFHIYKNIDDIPEDYYKKLGKIKKQK